MGEQSSQLAIVKPATGARVKFHHMVADGPGVSILVNGKQFSGVLTTPPATPGLITFPNFFPANDYATVDPGSAKVDVVAPSLNATIITGTLPLENDKYYSVFAVGSAATGGVLEAVVAEDKLTPADTSRAYIRLVNTVVNATTGYDMGFNNNFAAATTNVRYKQVSDFVAISPVPPGGAALPIQIRVNGTTANIAPTTLTLAPVKRRFYTVVLRGRVGGTGAQALTPALFTNR
ncbi:MAG: DUF4397 domain-containing protein [Runella sp.]